MEAFAMLSSAPGALPAQQVISSKGRAATFLHQRHQQQKWTKKQHRDESTWIKGGLTLLPWAVALQSYAARRLLSHRQHRAVVAMRTRELRELLAESKGACLAEVGSMPVARPQAGLTLLPKPVSVNYHFLRQCNYSCKFCFHTDLKSPWVGLNAAKKAIEMLKVAGTKKLNFSGGEPFLMKTALGEMCKYAKEIGIESVSIISNGSLITEEWMATYGKYVDIMGISCDSFTKETNEFIGRTISKDGYRHTENVFAVCQWCAQYGVKFKMNTVVNAFNHAEDMTDGLAKLKEIGLSRWKVFQCLAIEGENTGDNMTNRDVSHLLVTAEEYDAFLDRHADFDPVREDNRQMRNSYIILDEKLRFLNNQDGRKVPTRSILEVGVADALWESGWEEDTFQERGGVYAWTKDAEQDDL